MFSVYFQMIYLLRSPYLRLGMCPLCLTVASVHLSGSDTAKQSLMATRHGQRQYLQQKDPPGGGRPECQSPNYTPWLDDMGKHQTPWHVIVSSLKVGAVSPGSQASNLLTKDSSQSYSPSLNPIFSNIQLCDLGCGT